MTATLNLPLTSSGTAVGQQTLSRPQPLSPWRNPTQLEHPSFLLCFPFSYSTDVPNNPWMTDLDDARRQPDFKRAAVQFLELYRYLAAESLVHVLPTPREANLQDQVYTANLGIVLEHLEDKNTVVVSNFTSEPRRGETEVGVEFFRQMGYKVWFLPQSLKAKPSSSTSTKTSTLAAMAFAPKERPTSGWRKTSICKSSSSA